MDDLRKLRRGPLLDFERPRLDDALYVENNKPHGFAMDQNDGLPKPAIMTTMEETEAADLTPDRFVCMGDTGRPQCQHYKRQLLPSVDKQHTICLRSCTAVRGESGEFVDLANAEVLACEYRVPRDPFSERKLDDFDAVIMQRQKERREGDKPFDVDAALEEE